MTTQSLTCRNGAAASAVTVDDDNVIHQFLGQLANLYQATIGPGNNACQYWTHVKEDSEYPFSPLAHAPGVLVTLWTPDIAPAASTIRNMAYGFTAIAGHPAAFSCTPGVGSDALLAATGSDKIGLFGPSSHIANVVRAPNLLVRAEARMPIMLHTSAGVVRVLPRLVYARCGTTSVSLT